MAGYIYLEVEASSQEEAIEKGLEISWEDKDVVELDSYRSLASGNVLHVPRPRADARLLK